MKNLLTTDNLQVIFQCFEEIRETVGNSKYV